ncbi:hypothetical protein EVAR_61969_1 [Eumeta japonica]|uniref:Uncharacterized protein n=1 Tax=Eumeta variegata TaxID=151549 RepID=A0A4C1T6A6_EUMVA|nr:hypothetical protein EVAR_61969_1 [Eumeta japonica]
MGECSVAVFAIDGAETREEMSPRPAPPPTPRAAHPNWTQYEVCSIRFTSKSCMKRDASRWRRWRSSAARRADAYGDSPRRAGQRLSSAGCTATTGNSDK